MLSAELSHHEAVSLSGWRSEGGYEGGWEAGLEKLAGLAHLLRRASLKAAMADWHEFAFCACFEAEMEEERYMFNQKLEHMETYHMAEVQPTSPCPSSTLTRTPSWRSRR